MGVEGGDLGDERVDSQLRENSRQAVGEFDGRMAAIPSELAAATALDRAHGAGEIGPVDRQFGELVRRGVEQGGSTESGR